MNWETLVSWGDSITIGARSYLSYPEYAGDFLSKATQKSWHTPVHAVCGYTANDLNRSLTPELQNQKSLGASFLTIMIGTNDLKSPTSESTFRIAYQQVLVKARMVCRPSQILVLKIPKLKTGVMYPYRMEMNQTVTRFNEIIEELASEAKIRTLQIEFEDSDLYDGVHLNESGSQRVGKFVSEFILRDRGLSSSTVQDPAKSTPIPVSTLEASSNEISSALSRFQIYPELS